MHQKTYQLRKERERKGQETGKKKRDRKRKKRKGKKKHRKAQNKRQKRQKKSQIIRSLWGVAIIQRLIFPVDGEDVDPVDVDDVENVSCFFEGPPPPDCVSSLAQEMFGHKQTYVCIIYNIHIYLVVVGGFNPSEKYARQFGSFPQGSG